MKLSNNFLEVLDKGVEAVTDNSSKKVGIVTKEKTWTGGRIIMVSKKLSPKENDDPDVQAIQSDYYMTYVVQTLDGEDVGEPIFKTFFESQYEVLCEKLDEFFKSKTDEELADLEKEKRIKGNLVEFYKIKDKKVTYEPNLQIVKGRFDEFFKVGKNGRANYQWFVYLDGAEDYETMVRRSIRRLEKDGAFTKEPVTEPSKEPGN